MGSRLLKLRCLHILLAHTLDNFSTLCSFCTQAVGYRGRKLWARGFRGLSSLVPCPHVPPGEKQSGEQSRISWAYYLNVVMTNEIARSVIIT